MIKEYYLCKSIKINNYKPYSLLKILQKTYRLWFFITINFIIRLLKFKDLDNKVKYNSIIVIVNKIIKYVYFLLYKEKSKVEYIIYKFTLIVIA